MTLYAYKCGIFNKMKISGRINYTHTVMLGISKHNYT